MLELTVKGVITVLTLCNHVVWMVLAMQLWGAYGSFAAICSA